MVELFEGLNNDNINHYNYKTLKKIIRDYVDYFAVGKEGGEEEEEGDGRRVGLWVEKEANFLGNNVKITELKTVFQDVPTLLGLLLLDIVGYCWILLDIVGYC